MKFKIFLGCFVAFCVIYGMFQLPNYVETNYWLLLAVINYLTFINYKDKK